LKTLPFVAVMSTIYMGILSYRNIAKTFLANDFQ
jgi:hypothetical protein